MSTAKADKILEVGHVLFMQHGFKKVTMSELAEAAGISRPTLYAVFPSKEAVFEGIARRHTAYVERTVAERLPKARTVEAKLRVLFDVWIVEGFASVIDAPGGLELLGNTSAYAPVAYEDIYVRFEAQLLDVLAPEMKGKRPLRASDLARILTLAAKGLKATTRSLEELKRLTDGLVMMAIATTR